MNDVKNKILNVVISAGAAPELLNITIAEVNEYLRAAGFICVVIGFIWKWHRQGMFKKKKTN